MRSRPTRTLLGPSTTGTRAGAAPATTRVLGTVPDAAAPAEAFHQLPPAQLHEMLEQHSLLSRRLGRLVGVTTEWATTRWVAGRDRGTAVPCFRILVPGECPSREDGEKIARRLQRHGWAWRLVADHGSFRLDAKRNGATIVITARDNTISFVVQGAPLAIGPTQVRLLMAGVYEDD